MALPPSHLLRADLRPAVRPLIPDDDEYKRANDRYEYRVALLRQRLQNISGAFGGAPGEFIGDYRWTNDGQPLMEIDFRAASERAGD